MHLLRFVYCLTLLAVATGKDEEEEEEEEKHPETPSRFKALSLRHKCTERCTELCMQHSGKCRSGIKVEKNVPKFDLCVCRGNALLWGGWGSSDPATTVVAEMPLKAEYQGRGIWFVHKNEAAWKFQYAVDVELKVKTPEGSFAVKVVSGDNGRVVEWFRRESRLILIRMSVPKKTNVPTFVVSLSETSGVELDEDSVTVQLRIFTAKLGPRTWQPPTVSILNDAALRSLQSKIVDKIVDMQRTRMALESVH